MKFSSAAHLTGGGTISGDVTINGDLTVNGDGSGNYDEIINGNLQVGSAARSATILEAASDATKPSFTFTGDTNTGMGSASDNQINFITDGGTRMYIDAYGQVSIGAAPGNGKFAVTNTASNQPNIFLDHNSTATTTVSNRSLYIDFDKTGNTASGQTIAMSGLQIDMNNDSATDVGTTNLTGLDVNMTMGTSGTQKAVGLDVNVAGADTNISAHLQGVSGGFTTSGASLGTTSSYKIDMNGSNMITFHPGASNIFIKDNYNFWNSGGLSADAIQIFGGTGTTGAVLRLKTRETTVVADDVLGSIQFSAPLESSGSDAILVGASISALSGGTFTDTVNTTDLVFSTASSGTATEKMRINADGHLIPANGEGTQDIGTTSSKDWGTLFIRQIDMQNELLTIVGASTAATYKDHSSVGNGHIFYHRNAEAMRIGVSGSADLTTTITSSSANGSGTVTGLHLKNTGTTVNDGTKLLFTSGTSTAGASIYNQGKSGDSSDLVFEAGGSTERMRITAAGGVKFGGSSAADVSFEGSNTFPDMTLTGGQARILYHDSSGFENGILFDTTHIKFMRESSTSNFSFILDANSSISLSNNDGNTENTVFGKSAFNQGGDVGADYNVAIGHLAMGTGTLGNALYNVAVGWGALTDITTGDSNIGVGAAAGYNLVGGSDNIAIGTNALFDAVSVTKTVAIGTQALEDINDDANDGSVAIGYLAGSKKVGSGSQYTKASVHIGYSSGAAQTSGANNTSVGHATMGGNVSGTALTGNDNTVMGYSAGYAMSGASSSNTIVGSNSGLALTTSSNNVTIGHDSFKAVVDACNSNVSIGVQSMISVDRGSHADATVNGNIAIGYNALAGGDFASADKDLVGNIAIGKNTLDATGANAQTGTVAIGHEALTALTSGTGNVSLGYQAGMTMTTASNNILIGYQAGYLMLDNIKNVCIGTSAGGFLGSDEADENVFIGNNAGASGEWDESNNNTANQNVGIGVSAMGGAGGNDAAHFTAANNVALGFESLKAITTGGNNVAVGKGVGLAITTDQNVVAIGYGAYSAQDTSNDAEGSSGHGSGNISIGYQSMQSFNHVNFLRNTAIGFQTMSAGGDADAQDNVALGYRALQLVTTGDSNTSVGSKAGKSLTTGSSIVAIGYQAGDALTVGSSNVLVGKSAGSTMVEDRNCVAIGISALENANGGGSDGAGTDTNNTAVGAFSGDLITIGTGNTLLGSNTDVDANNRSGCIVIGSGLSLNTASDNVVEIGNNTNSMTYDLDGGDITVTSDVRTKKNIKDTKLGLEFINKLRPITYQTKSSSQYPKEFKVENPSKKSSGKTWDGLIAQEVKEVMDEMNVGFSGWEEGINTKQRLAYGKFVMPLIKAVQELSARVKELESK